MSDTVEMQTKTSRSGLSYLVSGSASSKRCLFCIHGWSCQGSDYTRVIQLLLKQHPNVLYVAPSQPGHGDTPSSLCEPATIQGFAILMLYLVHELGMEEVILVGHSMGDRMVCEIWSQAQQMSLDSPPPSPAPSPIKGIVLLDGSHIRLRAKATASDGDSDRPRYTSFEDIFNHEMFTAATPDDFRKTALAHVLARDMSYALPLRAVFGDYDVETKDGVLDEIGKTGTPLLQIQATDVNSLNMRTSLSPEEVSGYMQLVKEKVPGARQVVISDSGHFPHVDQPGAVADALGQFMQEIFKEN